MESQLRPRIIDLEGLRGEVIDLCTSGEHLYLIGSENQFVHDSTSYLVRVGGGYRLEGATRLAGLLPYACTYDGARGLIYVVAEDGSTLDSYLLVFDEALRPRARLELGRDFSPGDIAIASGRVYLLSTHNIRNRLLLAALDPEEPGLAEELALSLGKPSRRADLLLADTLIHWEAADRIVGLATSSRGGYHVLLDVDRSFRDIRISIIKPIGQDASSRNCISMTAAYRPFIPITVRDPDNEPALTTWGNLLVLVLPGKAVLLHPEQGVTATIESVEGFPYKVGIDYNLLYVFAQSDNGVSIAAISLHSKYTAAEASIGGVKISSHYWNDYIAPLKKKAVAFENLIVTGGYDPARHKPVLIAAELL